MSKNQQLSFLVLLFFLFGWTAAQADPLQEAIQLCDQGAYREAIPLLRSAFIAFEKDNNKQGQASAQEYLAKSYLFTGDIAKAKETYRLAYQLSSKHGSSATFNRTTDALAELYNMTGEYEKANPVLRQGIIQTQKEGNITLMTCHMSNLGISLLRLGRIDSAQYWIEKSLEIKLANQDFIDLEMHYNHLGNLFNETGDYDKAIDFQIKALKILERQNKKPQMVIQYANIATILSIQENLLRAEEYANKAIVLAREENLITWLAASLTTMGKIRSKQNRPDEALQYYEESLKLYRSADSAPLKSFLLARIGKIYLNKGFYERSESYFKEGLDIALIEGKKDDIISLNLSFVKLKLLQNKPAIAKIFLDSAQQHVIAYKQASNFSYYHELEMQYYQKIGNPQKALQAFRLAQEYKQESYNLEQSKKVHELEERYERAKKDQKITSLNSENKIKDLKIYQTRRNNIIASIALFFALGLMFVLYYLNRTRRLANESLGEKNITIANSLAEKEILLREIHHRVKNNLQVVSSLLRLQTKYIKDEKALDAIQEGRNRVKSMSLIHQNLYQVDNLTGVQASDYIEKLSQSLFHSYNIDAERIHLKTDIDDLNIDVDTIIPIGLILNELLSNALKHAFPNETEGNVTVKLKRSEDLLVLEVADDGVGISTDKKGNTKEGGFGTNLIDSFLEKLMASLEIKEKNGTAIKLSIRKFKLV